MEQWIYFYNKHTNERLGGYTLDGTFTDELRSTIELLAYEKEIKVTDIVTKVESKE